VFSTTFPLSKRNYLCFLQHSRLTLTFSTAILCFHRHPRLARSLFKINSGSQFGGGDGYLLEVLQFFPVFAQSHPAKAGQAKVFGQRVSAVLQCIDPAKAGLAAAERGPVECCAFRRAAASNAGVSWGDLRKDMVPPGAVY